MPIDQKLSDLTEGTTPDYAYGIEGGASRKYTPAELGGSGGLAVGTSLISGGTDGCILFQSGGLLQEDANLFWDNSNKFLGIGTNIPHAPLSFSPTLGNKIFLWDNGGGASYGLGIQAGLLQVFTDSSGTDIQFGFGGDSTSFTPNVTFKGNGFVGIGGTPAYTLDVFYSPPDSTTPGINLTNATNSSGSWMQFTDQFNGPFLFQFGEYFTNGLPAWFFYNATSGVQPLTVWDDGTDSFIGTGSLGVFGWGGAHPRYTDPQSPPTTGLSRIADAVVAVGNGASGDYSGTIQLTELNVNSNWQLAGVPGRTDTTLRLQNSTATQDAFLIWDSPIGGAGDGLWFVLPSVGILAWGDGGDIWNSTWDTAVQRYSPGVVSISGNVTTHVPDFLGSLVCSAVGIGTGSPGSPLDILSSSGSLVQLTSISAFDGPGITYVNGTMSGSPFNIYAGIGSNGEWSLYDSIINVTTFSAGPNGIKTFVNGIIGFTSDVFCLNAPDAAFSRLGADVVALGNGAQGDATGALALSLVKLQTFSNGSPANGDYWYDGSHLYFRQGGSSIDLLAAGSFGSLTVGSTAITSGGAGQVLFDSGGTLQEDANLFWDNTNKQLNLVSATTAEIICDGAPGGSSNPAGLILKNTAAGGWEIHFQTRPGFGWFEITNDSGTVQHAWADINYWQAASGVHGWNSSSDLNSGFSIDTGLSRLSTGVVAVGNGNPGDYSGTLICTAAGIGTNAPSAPLHVLTGTPSGTPVTGVNVLFVVEGDDNLGQGFAIINNRPSPADIYVFATAGGGLNGFEMYNATYDLDCFGGDVDHSTLSGYFCVNRDGIIGWSNHGNPRYAIASSIDTGLCRLDLAMAVGVGNGTAGDYSGFIVSKYHVAPDVGVYAFSSTGTWDDAWDVGISRAAAGVVAVGNGASGNKSGTLDLTSVILEATAIASLPGSPVAGQQATVNDALVPVVGSTVASGGSAFAAVCWNGSAWKVFVV